MQKTLYGHLVYSTYNGEEGFMKCTVPSPLLLYHPSINSLIETHLTPWCDASLFWVEDAPVSNLRKQDRYSSLMYHDTLPKAENITSQKVPGEPYVSFLNCFIQNSVLHHPLSMNWKHLFEFCRPRTETKKPIFGSITFKTKYLCDFAMNSHRDMEHRKTYILFPFHLRVAELFFSIPECGMWTQMAFLCCPHCTTRQSIENLKAYYT